MIFDSPDPSDADRLYDGRDDPDCVRDRIQKLALSRSSFGVGRKAGDFGLPNLCWNTIAIGFGALEQFQMVELAFVSRFCG